MIRTSLLKLLGFYQRFFTLVGFGSCRYYPTCSEYARWQFENNPLHSAFYHSFIRILRCNQLFPGGIDYPVANRLKTNPSDTKADAIKYWFVPDQKNRFFIIKNFNFKGSRC
jgi:putative membrane protein insertion efficiency factor